MKISRFSKKLMVRRIILWLTTLIGCILFTESVAEQTTTVSSKVMWFDTGIELQNTDLLTIQAKGQWTNGGDRPQWIDPSGFHGLLIPNDVVPTEAFGSLVGKVGSKSFLIGTSFNRSLGTSGRLYVSINDIPGNFGDNKGFLTLTIKVQNPTLTSRSQLYLATDQVKLIVKLALLGIHVQLSQTSNGTPLVIRLPNGDTRSVMSYIEFGSFLKDMGMNDAEIDIPIAEYSLDQIQDTNGSSIILQYFLNGVLFVDRVRFLLNNIQLDFSSGLDVQLANDEIILKAEINASDPAIKCESYAYTAVVFAIPIPIGWRDDLCPDVAINHMVATIHLQPVIDTIGQIRLNDPIVEVQADVKISSFDGLLKSVKTRILTAFQQFLTAELSKDSIKKPLENAIRTLILGENSSQTFSGIELSPDGINVYFR
jgi:PA-IL-like protein